MKHRIFQFEFGNGTTINVALQPIQGGEKKTFLEMQSEAMAKGWIGNEEFCRGELVATRVIENLYVIVP